MSRRRLKIRKQVTRRRTGIEEPALPERYAFAKQYRLMLNELLIRAWAVWKFRNEFALLLINSVSRTGKSI